jgi:hypothetical protein
MNLNVAWLYSPWLEDGRALAPVRLQEQSTVKRKLGATQYTLTSIQRNAQGADITEPTRLC